MSRTFRLFLAVVVALPLVQLGSSALAYPFTRPLERGDSGADVKALEVRISGWYSTDEQELLRIDRHFTWRTTVAVRRFQKTFGLTVDGVAGPKTYAAIDRLTSSDGSTLHFDWSEFQQHSNSNCSAKANSYAGTFKGGAVARKRVRNYVRRLMWRLEAVRVKGGRNPIGINSGFRSIPYNSCIGGASASQHLYGTAADNRMAEVTNRQQRDIAKRSQMHGVACYSSQSHNHFDLRIDNRHLDSQRAWWWPDRDSYGRDLDESGRVCWGESSSGGGGTASHHDIADGVPGAGSLVPSAHEVRLFQEAGEVDDLAGAD